MRHSTCVHKQKRRHFHAKTTVNRQSTHGAGHIPICTHGSKSYVPKHIGRPMSGFLLLIEKILHIVGSSNMNFKWSSGSWMCEFLTPVHNAPYRAIQEDKLWGLARNIQTDTQDTIWGADYVQCSPACILCLLLGDIISRATNWLRDPPIRPLAPPEKNILTTISHIRKTLLYISSYMTKF